MTDKLTLIKARALIADRENWCQDSLARDSDGAAVTLWAPQGDALNPAAKSFCARGALYAAQGHNHPDRVSTLLTEVAVDLKGMAPTAVNDQLGHEAVLAVYDEAIRRAK